VQECTLDGINSLKEQEGGGEERTGTNETAKKICLTEWDKGSQKNMNLTDLARKGKDYYGTQLWGKKCGVGGGVPRLTHSKRNEVGNDK